MQRIELNPELVRSLSAVVLLLRRAAELTWLRVQAEGVRSCKIFTALAIDDLADQTASLLPARFVLRGPNPLGNDVRELLRSAGERLELLATTDPQTCLIQLTTRTSDLARELDEFCIDQFSRATLPVHVIGSPPRRGNG